LVPDKDDNPGHRRLDSEGWLKHALGLGKMVLYRCDVATGLATRSENAISVLGLPTLGPTDAWSDLIAVDDLPYFENALKSATPENPGFEVEYRIRHAVTGTRFTVLDRGEAQYNAAGERIYVTGGIVDISGRIRSEMELREKNRLHEVAFQAAKMGAWHFDVGANTLTGTDELMAVLGIDRAQYDGDIEKFYKCVYPDDIADLHASRLRAQERGNQIEVEFRVMSNTGRVGWFLSRGQFIRDSNGIATECYGVMIDITERKAAEEAAARLAAIVASSEDAIFSTNLDGVVTSWNQSAERLFGYQSNEIIGGPVERIVPQERLSESRSNREIARKGDAIGPLETIKIKKNGEQVNVSLTLSPIRNSSGQISGTSTIARDITERKTWEQRQTMLVRELSHRVKNTLAVIQAMTRLTLRTNSDPRTFADNFESRIRSLASSHNLLTEANWRGAHLRDVIRSQLSGLVDDVACRFDLRGKDVILPAEASAQLGLVLHELGVNAIKHGALSQPGGRVGIVWTATSKKLRLTWRERGGPVIATEPSRIGFGTSLVMSSAQKVLRRFGPKGFTCKLELEL
jgi:PAS domain S-box-containing protein